MTMRYGSKDSDWTSYLTEEEFATYQREMGFRKWCLDRMKDHEKAIAGLEVIGRGRKAEARTKEAAE